MYEIIYWTENQDKINNAPKCYNTNDRKDFIHALEVLKDNGCEIEYATEL